MNNRIPVVGPKGGSGTATMKYDISTIRSGDVVQLLSGGPDMTVIAAPGEMFTNTNNTAYKVPLNKVVCMWFDEDKHTVTQSFYCLYLKIIKRTAEK